MQTHFQTISIIKFHEKNISELKQIQRISDFNMKYIINKTCNITNNNKKGKNYKGRHKTSMQQFIPSFSKLSLGCLISSFKVSYNACFLPQKPF